MNNPGEVSFIGIIVFGISLRYDPHRIDLRPSTVGLMVLTGPTHGTHGPYSWYSRARLMVLTGPAHGTHEPGPWGLTVVGIKNKGDSDVLFTMKDPPLSLERSSFIA